LKASHLHLLDEPPLYIADTHIFHNISELAVLSDMLVSKLETAIEDGGKEVGEIILEVVSLVPLEIRCIFTLMALTRYPCSRPIHDLHSPHTLAHSYTSTHSRSLKYGLLLGAVFSATPEPLIVVAL